jgi:hypothetical protein
VREVWWLSFLGGDVVVLEASSLAHARLLAAQNNLGRVSNFAEGYSIHPELAAMVPDDSIGRMLSPMEARKLLKLLKYGPRGATIPQAVEPDTVPTRRRA